MIGAAEMQQPGFADSAGHSGEILTADIRLPSGYQSAARNNALSGDIFAFHSEIFRSSGPMPLRGVRAPPKTW